MNASEKDNLFKKIKKYEKKILKAKKVDQIIKSSKK